MRYPLDPNGLVAASASGDLRKVKGIFEWEKRFPKSLEDDKRIMFAAHEAVRGGHVDVIEYFLTTGYPITSRLISHATACKLYPALELFLSKGWHVNDQLDTLALGTALTSVINHQPAQKRDFIPHVYNVYKPAF